MTCSTTTFFRALARHLRRHVPKQRWFAVRRRCDLNRSDKRSVLTWHHVAVRAQNDAAIARRQGFLPRARQELALARDANQRSKGWIAV